MSDPHRSHGPSAAATLSGMQDIPPKTSTEAPVLVVGLGEIGGRAFHGVRVLHLCFPFGPDFVTSASRYVSLYQPEVVVVNSTVVPGTTRAIQEKTGTPAVYSPVRGKHVRMTEELRRYRKFVAGASAETVALVEDHF